MLFTTIENSLTIRPGSRIGGSISVPGDKSLSHRAVIFASIADGASRITGFLHGEDCLCTVSAMQALGSVVEQRSETELIIEGIAGKLQAPLNPIDCGNSGTAIRLLTGLLAGQSFKSQVFGDDTLCTRPMVPIIEPLTLMGGKIIGHGASQKPPLHINGGSLHGINYKMPVASHQLKSCVLMAGLFAKGTTTIIEKVPTQDHTERMLSHFHAPLTIEIDDAEVRNIRIRGGTRLSGRDFEIPGDVSSAAFWVVAAAVQPGAELTIDRVGLNPTRTGFLAVLLRMGAQIHENVSNPQQEPIGTLQVRGSHLRGTKISGKEIVSVIDELPILMVAGALAEGDTEIRDATELRGKEIDQIEAMALNLRAFGVEVTEHPDGMTIHGRANPRGAQVSSFGDHRVAMACAILGLFCRGETTILNASCINAAYPTFKADMEKVTTREEPAGLSNLFGLSR